MEAAIEDGRDASGARERGSPAPEERKTRDAVETGVKLVRSVPENLLRLAEPRSCAPFASRLLGGGPNPHADVGHF
jgi:hypothetical protein